MHIFHALVNATPLDTGVCIACEYMIPVLTQDVDNTVMDNPIRIERSNHYHPLFRLIDNLYTILTRLVGLIPQHIVEVGQVIVQVIIETLDLSAITRTHWVVWSVHKFNPNRIETVFMNFDQNKTRSICITNMLPDDDSNIIDGLIKAIVTDDKYIGVRIRSAELELTTSRGAFVMLKRIQNDRTLFRLEISPKKLSHWQRTKCWLRKIWQLGRFSPTDITAFNVLQFEKLV